jgi:hypothetical protein
MPSLLDCTRQSDASFRGNLKMPMIKKADRLIGAKQIRAIETVLNYLWADEKANYESCPASARQKHVFAALLQLDNWLDK